MQGAWRKTSRPVRSWDFAEELWWEFLADVSVEVPSVDVLMGAFSGVWNIISPPVGFNKPRMHLISVVLPPPFGPIIPRKSCS